MPALQDLRERYPAITVTLLTALNIADISYHGADLAIRGARPDDDELIIKRLATIEMGLYASPHYGAARHAAQGRAAARPRSADVPARAGAAPLEQFLRRGPARAQRGAAMQFAAAAAFRYPQRAGHRPALRVLADKDPELVRLLPENKDWVDIWLVLHPDLQRAARVRAVVQALETSFSAHYG